MFCHELIDNYVSFTMTDFEKTFSAYRSIQESQDTLFTVLVHSLSIGDTILAVEHRLQLAKDMRVSKKKATICLRLTNFKAYLDQLESTSTINSIFLLSDQIVEIKLTSEWRKVVTTYGVETFLFKYNPKFEIDYLQTLLTDLNFHHVIYIKNNEYSHMIINSTKKKLIFHKESKAFDLNEYVQKTVTDKCIIHGVSSILKSLQIGAHSVYNYRLTDDEILETFEKEAVKQIHAELEEYFEYIRQKDKLHRLAFGKEIEVKIKEQTLKVLYCSPDVYIKIMAKLPKSFLGGKFQVHKVDSISKGDAGDRLKTDFSGAIGVTYY
jgi:hypothetical protein